MRLKNTVWISLWLLFSGFGGVGQQTVSGFDKPVLLKNNEGKPIEIETGCCAPFMRDMDNDGRADLLLGEFGSFVCPGYENKAKSYVQGRCRVFHNLSDAGKPELLPYKWLESEGQPLYVPITCCMPMSPAFADINGDGRDDLISGSYPGELYWWPALPDGSWGQRQVLADKNGKTINLGAAVTVFAADMNGNGVSDLLVNGLYDGVFWVENLAKKNERARFYVHPDRLTTVTGRELEGTYAITEDWDGDGKDDLLFGDQVGGIYWCRSTGIGFGEPELLVAPRENNRVVLVGDSLTVPGHSPRFCMHDWDGNGKRDLMVTTEIGMQQQRHLNPGQLEEKAKLQKEYKQKSNAWAKLRDKDRKSVV